MGIDDFTIGQFDKFISTSIYRNFEQKQLGNEYIYDSNLGDINGNRCIIRVYSSVDTQSNNARKTGKDAIRVNICDKYGDALLLKDEKYRHIKRTDGWKKRLSKLLKDYDKKFPNNISLCPECSSPLKIKSGKHGKFISCSSWSPDNEDSCDYTDSL